ncbi:hypothetical protein F8388_013573 [Cannabis sativa]|uniref:non-specific serine/threonine protein kinase n=1 Tax=Cannabis sativa TaxID=3483 RepID=A0A7J6G8R2_CANSA|nr:hypothetical protein F8388_013573 [Cannabis sativa]KAF4398455.1 hypothetical protein G4B88_025434 [Cannabis sativa]
MGTKVSNNNNNNKKYLTKKVKVLPFLELWFGPSYSNSPPATSLPISNFTIQPNTTMSLVFLELVPNEDLREWTEVWHATHELCTIHGTCGANAICTSDGSNSSSCVCPPGFAGDNPKEKGCERKIQIMDLKKTKYIRLDYVNFTTLNEVSLSGATNLSDCELNCTRNRDCLGFMFKYDGRGSCVLKNKNDSDNRLVNVMIF